MQFFSHLRSSVNMITEKDREYLFHSMIKAYLILRAAYGYWWRPFFTNAWSLFDLAVVVLSLVALGPIEVPIRCKCVPVLCHRRPPNFFCCCFKGHTHDAAMFSAPSRWPRVCHTT